MKMIWKMWPTLKKTKMFRRKSKENPPNVRPRDGLVEHMCKDQGLENGVDIWNFVLKNEKDSLIPSNYFILV